MPIRVVSVEKQHADISNEVLSLADIMTERIKEQIRIYESYNPDYKFDKVEYDYNSGNWKLNILYKHKDINREAVEKGIKF